jgi:hypothetical protein
MGISNNVYEEFEDNKGGEFVNQRRPVNTMGKQAQKDKQRSTNQYIVNYRSSNTSPT